MREQRLPASPAAASGTRSAVTLAAPAAALPDCSAARPNFPAALAPPTVAPPKDGIYNLVMITLFRIAFARALGQQSAAPWFPAASSYDGLVDMARKLYVALPGTDARSRVVGDLFRAFPQTPQLLQNDRVSMEGLATLTTGLFPFLVGPCRRESWEASDGTPWRSKVVIERCRFLEESACKGMCVGLCKQPTEAYFASIGLPLSLTPTFEDGSCEMCWGRAPRDDDLADADMGCYGSCGLLHPKPAAAAET